MTELKTQSDQAEHLHHFFRQWLESEEQRKKLARTGRLEKLRELYNDGAVHLPGINSSLKWDFYSFRDFDHIDKITAARIQAVIEHVPLTARVLDYGCGYGYVLGQAMSRKREWQYTGIDFSVKFISKLNRKYPQARFIAGDLSAVEDNSFDAVLLLEILEHIPSNITLPFLADVRKKLTSTGRLIISVPLYEDIATNTCPCWSCGELGNPNGHVRSYTPTLIQAELQLAGFTIMESIDIFAKSKQLMLWKNRLKQLLGMKKSKPANLVVVAG